MTGLPAAPPSHGCDPHGPEHAAVHRRLLGAMACALEFMARDRAAGIAYARDALRAEGWRWPELLTARTAAYRALLRTYGHADLPSPTAPSRCGPVAPCGRLADGTWHPGWTIVCGRAIAERVAWAGVPLLAEAALFAAVECPSDAQVDRLDALMRAVWREPAAPLTED